MRNTLWMLALGATLFLGARGWAKEDSQASDDQASCRTGCHDDSATCQKVCQQHAGGMVGRCVQACKDEERACQKDCTQGEPEEGK